MTFFFISKQNLGNYALTPLIKFNLNKKYPLFSIVTGKMPYAKGGRLVSCSGVQSSRQCSTPTQVVEFLIHKNYHQSSGSQPTKIPFKNKKLIDQIFF